MIQWARHIPVRPFTRMHRAGRQWPEADHVVEPAARLVLGEACCFWLAVVLWWWILLPVAPVALLAWAVERLAEKQSESRTKLVEEATRLDLQTRSAR